MLRVSELEFRKEFDQASTAFDTCWGYLCDIKTATAPVNPESFLDFQPKLASAIAALSCLYARLSEERRGLVARKSKLSQSWLVKRLRLIGSRQEALNFTISIGKCLGDSFAFFFYRNDLQLLCKHLLEPAARHLPTGIGGIGEVEFVKKIKVVGGKMVLYHGITSILRIADVSLIDLAKFRVAGLGELKSWSPKQGALEIMLRAIGPGLDLPHISNLDASPSDRFTSRAEMSPSAKDRLSRQLKKMEESFKREQITGRAAARVESRNHLRVFHGLVRKARRNKFSFLKADNGLLLGVFRSPYRSLLAKATRKLDVADGLVSVESRALVLSLLDITRDDNLLSVGMLVYDPTGQPLNLAGAAPCFWWDLPIKTLRALIFHDVIASTVFNPAHLLASLERADFKVEVQPDLQFRVTKRVGSRVVELTGLIYYFQLIQQCLFTEAFMLQLISQFGQLGSDMVGPNDAAKIDLIFNQEISLGLRRYRRHKRKRASKIG